MTSWAADPPLLRAVAKTHKEPGEGGRPKSRPICDASGCYNTPFGELVADLITPITKSRGNQVEVQSTEELLSRITAANQKLEKKETGETLVGSMDVCALYPSLNQKVSAKIVEEEMMRNGVRYQGVNTRLATHYLLANMDKERQRKEGIVRLLPRRKAQGRQGRIPTIHTKELSGPIKRRTAGSSEEEGAETEKTDDGEQEEYDTMEERFGGSGQAAQPPTAGQGHKTGKAYISLWN